jgi:hypothetical protein
MGVLFCLENSAFTGLSWAFSPTKFFGFKNRALGLGAYVA